MNAKEVKVGDLMNRDIKTINKTTRLMAAVEMMRSLGISSLIVEPDNDLDAYGIITRKDIVEALVENNPDINSLFVEDSMTKPAITINPELSVYNCHQIMRMVGVRRMPVVDRGKLVGIISNSDIFNKIG